MREFLGRFKFRPEGSLLVGVERECHLIANNGSIAPIAEKVLSYLGVGDRFGYELSACQLEDRAGPCKLDQLREQLLSNDLEIKQAERVVGFSRSFFEVAPDDMPLDVYPDPTGRYQRIVKTIPDNVLLAACQVIGIHVHIGMPDHHTALRVYNKAIGHTKALCELGDGSYGRRMAIYRVMAPDYIPPQYKSWQHYYNEAVTKGFDADPRKCWHLIRISVHGTIEFRMFGSTDDLDRIMSWVTACYNTCRQAMV